MKPFSAGTTSPEQALLEQALQYQQNGNAAQAESLYRQLVGMKSRQPAVYIRYAELLQETGRIPQAIAICRQLVTLYPDMAEAHYQLATYYAGQDKAKEALEAAEGGGWQTA